MHIQEKSKSKSRDSTIKHMEIQQKFTSLIDAKQSKASNTTEIKTLKDHEATHRNREPIQFNLDLDLKLR